MMSSPSAAAAPRVPPRPEPPSAPPQGGHAPLSSGRAPRRPLRSASAPSVAAALSSRPGPSLFSRPDPAPEWRSGTKTPRAPAAVGHASDEELARSHSRLRDLKLKNAIIKQDISRMKASAATALAPAHQDAPRATTKDGRASAWPPRPGGGRLASPPSPEERRGEREGRRPAGHSERQVWHPLGPL